jgi:hypothetical protein
MKKSVMIKIPSQREYFSIVNMAIEDISSKIGFSKKERKKR